MRPTAAPRTYLHRWLKRAAMGLRLSAENRYSKRSTAAPLAWEGGTPRARQYGHSAWLAAAAFPPSEGGGSAIIAD